jgi:GMP synthase (glutamine-hydrolysing)
VRSAAPLPSVEDPSRMTGPTHAVAYVHEPHEGIARLGPFLEAAGFRVQERYRAPDPEADVRAPLVVVLGGPMSVYEADRFPFLRTEQDVLRARLAADRPSIGLCLGAQLLAAAAGSTVRRGAQGKRIGVGPVRPVAGSSGDPLLRELPGAFDVVHWHGDTFEPVPGVPLFTGETYPAQGFRLGRSVGLQFHAELGPDGFRDWVEGSADALRASGRDPVALLASGLPRLEAALPVLDRLLDGLARQARDAVDARTS